MVRAVAILWLFGGLRRDEIHRMRVGAIRWSPMPEGPDTPQVCLLDVPVNKTSRAFTKPVDPIVGTAIEAWEAERLPHPRDVDIKTGERVDWLFVHKGRRMSAAYINRSLIPLLCAKAGLRNRCTRSDYESPCPRHNRHTALQRQGAFVAVRTAGLARACLAASNPVLRGHHAHEVGALV